MKLKRPGKTTCIAWAVFCLSFFISFVALPRLGYLEIIPFFDWRLFHDSPSTSVFYDIEFEDGKNLVHASGAIDQPDKGPTWKITQNFGQAIDANQLTAIPTFVKHLRKQTSGYGSAPAQILRITVPLDVYVRNPDKRAANSLAIFRFSDDR